MPSQSLSRPSHTSALGTHGVHAGTHGPHPAARLYACVPLLHVVELGVQVRAKPSAGQL
ncbi:MAG: hypothetical protein IPH80_11335 [Myxococcales bacterium]|nr:hypothetical protein [Myxococcales bacterium]